MFNILKLFKSKKVSLIKTTIVLANEIYLPFFNDVYSNDLSLKTVSVLFDSIEEYNKRLIIANNSLLEATYLQPQPYTGASNVILLQMFLLSKDKIYLDTNIVMKEFINNIINFLTTYEECENEVEKDLVINRNLINLTRLATNAISIIENLHQLSREY
jgi:hypothetical protein